MSRLERLLELVADRPEGRKVDIPAIVRALTPTQQQIIEGIGLLIRRGLVDGATLRRRVGPPPKNNGGCRADDVPAAVILPEILAFLERSQMTASRFGRECVGDAKFMYGPRNGRSVRAKTAAKIRAFIAERDACAPPQTDQKCLPETSSPDLDTPTSSNPPEPEVGAEGGGADARTLAPPPTRGPCGAELRQELLAFIEEHGLSKTAVGTRLFNNTGALALMRYTKHPRAKTVAKVRAFISSAPPAELKLKPRRGCKVNKAAERVLGSTPIREPAPRRPARVRPPSRDPTQPPDTPMMDLRGHLVTNGRRHAAEVRRGQEKEAAARLDEGKEGRSSVERNLMAQIQRRRDEEARAADPVEQAKTLIRRRTHLPVFNAEVSIGNEGKGKFFVGSRLIDETELLNYAKRFAA
jgi:hypothetical protein